MSRMFSLDIRGVVGEHCRLLGDASDPVADDVVCESIFRFGTAARIEEERIPQARLLVSSLIH